MLKRVHIAFSVQALSEHDPGVHTVVPLIDGEPLTHMAAGFERAHDYEPVGGYGGIIPIWFNYGPLDKYFLGETAQDGYWAQVGGVYVLGCECGEVGCWPLQCRVRFEDDVIIWDEFKQPYRASRDYSGFGPFVFDCAQY